MKLVRLISTIWVAGSLSITSIGATGPVMACEPDKTPVLSGVADPFYAQPQSFDGHHPGDVLKSRTVNIQGLSQYSAYQVQYVSTNTVGAPQANVATILRPQMMSRPAKLVSFQPPIDTLSYDCDPSYRLRTGSEGDLGKIATLLSKGWVVVVPDFLGPDHEWVAGYVEAKGTLDGIRAAENFASAGLAGAATPVGMIGYSGGARGTEFANELASTYAPELNLVGAASGGLAVDVGEVLEHLNGGPAAGIAFAGFFGISRAYPAIGLDALLNQEGQQLRRTIGTQCIEQFAGSYPNKKIESFVVGGVNPWAIPRIREIFAQVAGGKYGKPKSPSYFYVGDEDELVVPENMRKLAKAYCKEGDSITYVVLQGDHRAADVAGFPGAVTWLNERFSGRREAGSCSMLS